MAFDYSLYVDIVNKRLVAGFATNTDAPEQVFRRTNEPTLQIQFLQPVAVASIFGNISQPFTYVDYSASTVALAVGDVKARPASGTFTLTYGANTTPSLAYDISPAALQTAVNLLASVIAFLWAMVIKDGRVRLGFFLTGALCAAVLFGRNYLGV